MIVGLCGPKGAGKSELAKLLFTRHGFERIAFSDALKCMLQALYEYQGLRGSRARRMLWGDLKEDSTRLISGKSSRYAMQTLGSEWGRNQIHPDLWVDIWSRRVRDKKKVVVEDLRFLNEAEAIRNSGGKIFLVDRNEFRIDSHISELEYIHIAHDGIILNDSSREDLLTQAEILLNL